MATPARASLSLIDEGRVLPERTWAAQRAPTRLGGRHVTDQRQSRLTATARQRRASAGRRPAHLRLEPRRAPAAAGCTRADAARRDPARRHPEPVGGGPQDWGQDRDPPPARRAG